MASNHTAGSSPSPAAPESLPPALLEQYLDAMLAGHPPPAAHKASVDFGLLHAVASPDTALHDKARRVLEAMNVMERWRLARMVDDVAAPARDLVKQGFTPFQVGMLPEDFTGTPARDYPAGTRLFAAGDEAHEAFLIEQGRILISKNGRPVAQLGRNEFFGNLPFLLPVQRTADAFALDPARVRVLHKEAYLAKFKNFSASRQADEWRLAHLMLRQLILGLARYDTTVKVLVDYLFPDLTRNEQAEALQQWIDHFINSSGLGEARLYGLFNLFEMLDRELLLLAHLDHAGAEAVERIRHREGILRSVAVSGLRKAPTDLSVFEQPPKFLRLAETTNPWPSNQTGPLDVVCLPAFLWPDEGSRHATLNATQARTFVECLQPESWVYLPAPPDHPLLTILQQAGLFAGEIVPGLYALSPAGSPKDLRAPGTPPTTDKAPSGWRQWLSRWTRR